MTIIARDLELAAYVFVEFPKWVTLADGSQELVQNGEEEAVLTSKDDEAQAELDTSIAATNAQAETDAKNGKGAADAKNAKNAKNGKGAADTGLL